MASDIDAQRAATGSGERIAREAIAAWFARRQAAFDNLDAEALAADYADDAVIESPLSGRHGKAQAAHNLRVVFSAFMDMKLSTDSLIIEGQRIAHVTTVEGTNIGGLFGSAASGKAFRIPAVFIYDLKDGLIMREQRVYDFTGLLVQVGVLKAKPA